MIGKEKQNEYKFFTKILLFGRVGGSRGFKRNVNRWITSSPFLDRGIINWDYTFF